MDKSSEGAAKIIDGIAIAKDIRSEITSDVQKMKEVYGKVSLKLLGSLRILDAKS